MIGVCFDFYDGGTRNKNPMPYDVEKIHPSLRGGLAMEERWGRSSSSAAMAKVTLFPKP